MTVSDFFVVGRPVNQGDCCFDVV